MGDNVSQRSRMTGVSSAYLNQSNHYSGQRVLGDTAGLPSSAAVDGMLSDTAWGRKGIPIVMPDTRHQPRAVEPRTALLESPAVATSEVSRTALAAGSCQRTVRGTRG